MKFLARRPNALTRRTTRSVKYNMLELGRFRRPVALCVGARFPGIGRIEGRDVEAATLLELQGAFRRGIGQEGPLEKLAATVDFERFRPILEKDPRFALATRMAAAGLFLNSESPLRLMPAQRKPLVAVGALDALKGARLDAC